MQQTSKKSMVSSSNTQILTSVEVTLVLIFIHSNSELIHVCLISDWSLKVLRNFEEILSAFDHYNSNGEKKEVFVPCASFQSQDVTHCMKEDIKGQRIPMWDIVCYAQWLKHIFLQNALGINKYLEKKNFCQIVFICKGMNAWFLKLVTRII